MNAIAVMALAAALAAPEKTAADWTLLDLGTLGGPGAYAAAVSDAGQVVGCADTTAGATHAFLYEEGVMTDLAPLSGATASCALAVNSKGVVAGRVGDDLVLWKDGGQARLGVQGDIGGINETDAVVGSYRDGTATRAFLYVSGALSDLPMLGEGTSAAASAINEKYQIVGASNGRAFLWDQGRMTDLGTLGGTSGNAKGINDRGEIVGMASTGHAQPASFLYDGTMRELPAPEYSAAVAINNAGTIVGSGEGIYGYVIDKDGYTRLDAIAAVAAKGWRHLEPKGINASGWIVGSATDADGNLRAFLLKPSHAAVKRKGGG